MAQQPGIRGVLARAGNRYVTETEFVRRFELTPALYRKKGSALKRAKEELLYSLIAEKILAQEAADAGLDGSDEFLQSLESVRRLLARDQLYREEISGRIAVTEAEVQRGMKESRRQLTLSFVFVPDKQSARFLRDQIQTSEDFDALVIDSTMNAIRDAATIIWGDADWSIEREAYGLPPNGISDVQEAGAGFYFFKVIREIPSQLFSSKRAEELRTMVEETLRLRKERIRLDEFVDSAIVGRTGYAVTEAVRGLSKVVSGVFHLPGFDGDSVITASVRQEAERNLASSLADTAAVAGNHVWTVRDVLVQLEREVQVFPERDFEGVFRLATARLRIWVQQALLSDIGIELGLDKRPEVMTKLQIWRDAMLADVVRNRIRDSVTVNEADLWGIVASQRPDVKTPRATIREFWTSSIAAAESLLKDITMASASVQSSMATVSINERPPVGHIAFSLPPGSVYGPLEINDRYLVFQVVERDTHAVSAFLNATERKMVEAEAVQRKFKQRLARYVSSSVRERGFAVFLDQVDRISVSAIPMMTFRILGFGGRMLEVPFVQPQTDWLNIEIPDEAVP